MSSPRLDFVTCASPIGMHRLAYWEWGDPDNEKVLLCVHGLTRTGRDFDTLARRMAGEYRVICPDVVGRGASDWLANPAFYTVPQYVADMTTLLARLQPATLHWVGTSMGGIIGMALGGSAILSHRIRAAGVGRPAGGPALPDTGWHIAKMVINDVGPRLASEAIARIGEYVGTPVEFADFDSAVAYVRDVSGSFGPHTDEQWRELTAHVFVERNGRWGKHYDVNIAVPFAVRDEAAVEAGEQFLWQAYDALDCPLLIIRGEQSDLLTPATVAEMGQRNPRARALEVAGVGHAPTLMADSQIAPVAHFLLED
ncbi:alpha/beta fold hydrolase [Bordetella sp. N]|uniref:alpha/beta fold hydrolase n=1 Tax=Bordetella sp. N TaxID=1746199 RepID=UPI000710853B|nr:alpha/beta hydrolase [Bordetella sp. N]ALM82316.1 alpha/beta hydrolase [Bordetella sp. N]